MKPIDGHAMIERVAGLYAKGSVDLSYFNIVKEAVQMEPEKPLRFGRWVQVHGDFMTPGGTPYFICGRCGESGHLHGVEYPRRKIVCDVCGRVNIYPWENSYEEKSGSIQWEDEDDD